MYPGVQQTTGFNFLIKKQNPCKTHLSIFQLCIFYIWYLSTSVYYPCIAALCPTPPPTGSRISGGNRFTAPVCTFNAWLDTITVQTHTSLTSCAAAALHFSCFYTRFHVDLQQPSLLLCMCRAFTVRWPSHRDLSCLTALVNRLDAVSLWHVSTTTCWLEFAKIIDKNKFYLMLVDFLFDGNSAWKYIQCFKAACD